MFYNYNPKGYSEKKQLPKGYCIHCRCPDNYCADKFFGEISSDHALDIMYENGSHGDFDVGDMKFYFCKAYTNAVKSKMRMNKTKLPLGSTSIDVYKTPECMNRGSVKYFLKEFKLYKKKDANYPDWSDLDMKEGEPIGPQSNSD